MADTKAFIEAFMAKAAQVNPRTYYEEVPVDAVMPYAAVALRFQDSDESTYTVMVDVDVWHVEGAGHAAALEALCNTLKSGLDGVVLYTSGKFRAVVWFESQLTVVEPEVQLIHRQQIYQARIYFET